MVFIKLHTQKIILLSAVLFATFCTSKTAEKQSNYKNWLEKIAESKTGLSAIKAAKIGTIIGASTIAGDGGAEIVKWIGAAIEHRYYETKEQKRQKMAIARAEKIEQEQREAKQIAEMRATWTPTRAQRDAWAQKENAEMEEQRKKWQAERKEMELLQSQTQEVARQREFKRLQKEAEKRKRLRRLKRLERHEETVFVF